MPLKVGYHQPATIDMVFRLRAYNGPPLNAFAIVHSLMNNIYLNDSCQAHLPV